MVELKDYFDGIRQTGSKVLVWIPGSDDQPVAMNTYIEEVFLFEDKLAGLGITPKIGSGYMEFVSMEQLIKFTIVPEDMVDEFFERAKPVPEGAPKQ